MSSQRHGDLPFHSHSRERLCSGSPFHESIRTHACGSLRRAAEGLRCRNVFDNSNQTTRIPVWQWSEKNRVDDAENGSIRANAKTKCENRHDDESRTASHLTECIPQVLH